MKIKCHWCGQPLSNGLSYSLECNFDQCCKLSFDREGKISAFDVDFITERKTYNIRGGKYGIDLSVKGKRGHFHSVYFISNKQATAAILTVVEGMPQVEQLFNKLKTYVIFS